MPAAQATGGHSVNLAPWTDLDELFGKKEVFQLYSTLRVGEGGELIPQLDTAANIARMVEHAAEMKKMGLDSDGLSKVNVKETDVKQYDPHLEPLHVHYCCADMSLLFKGQMPHVLKCPNKGPLFWKRTWSGPNTWALRGHCTAEGCPDGNYCIDPRFEGDNRKKWKQTDMLRNDYIVAVESAKAVALILEARAGDNPPTVQQAIRGYGRALRVRCGVHFKYAVYTDLHREHVEAVGVAAVARHEQQQQACVRRTQLAGRGGRGGQARGRGGGGGGRGARGRGAAPAAQQQPAARRTLASASPAPARGSSQRVSPSVPAGNSTVPLDVSSARRDAAPVRRDAAPVRRTFPPRGRSSSPSQRQARDRDRSPARPRRFEEQPRFPDAAGAGPSRSGRGRAPERLSDAEYERLRRLYSH